jgi:hypothetical protein
VTHAAHHTAYETRDAALFGHTVLLLQSHLLGRLLLLLLLLRWRRHRCRRCKAEAEDAARGVGAVCRL